MPDYVISARQSLGTVQLPGGSADSQLARAALPGWHVAAAFRDQAPPAAWEAASITLPEGMPLFGPVPTIGLPDYEAALDAHVEAVAAAKGYKTAASCAGYVSSTIPAWAAEAAAFIAWRDAVWIGVYAALAAVQGGAPAPSVDALVAGLPAMVWPA